MRYIEYFIKGILIGISFLVPGMSGGTMMVLLGVFDDAIHSINQLTKRKLHKMDLMVIMGIGTVVALVLFAPIILLLIRTNYTLTVSFFFGVIAAGFWYLLKEINLKSIHLWDIIYLLVGIGIVLVLDGQSAPFLNLEAQSGIMRFIGLLIAGIPIAIALILPGISTSFMLLSIGAFEMVLNAIMTVDLSVLFPLGIGTIIGTFSLTGFLEIQLKHHKRRLYLIIIGFIIGSVIEMIEIMPIVNVGMIPIMVGLFLLGIILMVFIDKFK